MKLTRRRQQFQIEKMSTEIKKRKGKLFPKIFIKLTKKGYTIYGFEKKDSDREEVVIVSDCSNMNTKFFSDVVLGSVGYFLGINDEQISDFLYLGRINNSSDDRLRWGGKYS